jgi:2-dehydro-3-deoxyphosphogluconate aldolase / (4S)-4-hydroxy-2-oxoglutarate aldolase
MLTTQQGLQYIRSTGALLIIRLPDGDDAYQVAEAAIDGGFRALEVTYSVPGALDIIARLAKKHGDQVLVGAGTVVDEPSAVAAINVGARLLVSPHVAPGMIAVAKAHDAVSVCGAFSPTEMVSARDGGADIVKYFPAEFGGPAYVKAVTAPFPNMPILPTGGVTIDNIKQWLDAGVYALGVGSFVSKAAADSKPLDYGRVTSAAREFLKAVESARR